MLPVWFVGFHSHKDSRRYTKYSWSLYMPARPWSNKKFTKLRKEEHKIHYAEMNVDFMQNSPFLWVCCELLCLKVHILEMKSTVKKKESRGCMKAQSCKCRLF